MHQFLEPKNNLFLDQSFEFWSPKNKVKTFFLYTCILQINKINPYIFKPASLLNSDITENIDYFVHFFTCLYTLRENLKLNLFPHFYISDKQQKFHIDAT